MKKVLEALTEMQIKMPIEVVLLILLVAFLVSLVIFITYKHTYSGVMYNPRFNVSLIMITMVTTMVMIVIGSNISVSLGMVGALSIIRFRTAVKDPRDTAFIFWCVVSGLACGTQNYTIVIVGSILMSIILFVFKRVASSINKYVLVVKGTNIDISKIEEVLNDNVHSYLCKGKYVSESNTELIYDVKINKSKDVVSTLTKEKGIKTVNLVASNTDTLG